MAVPVIADIDPLATASIAVAVSLLTTMIAGVLRLYVERRLTEGRATTELQREQRARLHAELDVFRGQLLEVANPVRNRLRHIHEFEQRGDLLVDGRWLVHTPAGHVHRTTVYRFAVFVATMDRFERHGLYIDERYADPRDRHLLGYVKAIRWSMTDPSLFDSEDYASDEQTAHFFVESYRQVGRHLLDDEGLALLFDDFAIQLADPTQDLFLFLRSSTDLSLELASPA